MGTSALNIDPGAPIEFDNEPSAPASSKPAPTEAETRIAALEEQLKEQRDQLRLAHEDVRHLSRQIGTRPAQVTDPDDDPKPTAAARVDEKDETFIDDAAVDGKAALKKRGFVTKDDLDRAVYDATKRAKDEIRGETAAAQSDAQIDALLNQDYPDVVADVERIKAGRAPQTPLFKRASDVYKELIALDPKAEGMKLTLLAAVRQADAELGGGKGKRGALDAADPPVDRAANRRERINRATPDRGGGAATEHGEGTVTLTAEQQQVARGLGITNDQFVESARKMSNGSNKRK